MSRAGWETPSGARGAAVGALRGAKHVLVRIEGEGPALYCDVVECGAELVRLKPWGFRSHVDVEIDRVASAVPAANVASYARVQSIASEQKKWEATWPR